MPPKKSKHGYAFQVQVQPARQAEAGLLEIHDKNATIKLPRQCRFVQDKNMKSTPASSPPARTPIPGKHAPAKSFVFATNMTATNFTDPLEKLQQSPPAKRQKTESSSFIPSALTARKPIKKYIPMDAWAVIFSRSHPKFLLRARLVCRDFNDILKHQAIWKRAREYSFGEQVPPCPQDLTEFEYANLLVGRGCQVQGCHRRETRKSYWPFAIRACEECFTRMIRILPDNESLEAVAYEEYYENLDPEMRRKLPENLGDLLPAGRIWSGKWMGVRNLDDSSSRWIYEQGEFCVLAKDYARLQEQFAAEVMTEPSNFLSWTRKKWSLTKERMRLASRIKMPDSDVVDQRALLRMEKERFFRKRAEELEPPMDLAVLQCMAAYWTILDNKSPPSARSWDLLCARINTRELRTQAEQLIKWERESNRYYPPLEDILEGSNEKNLRWDKLARHRHQPVYKRAQRIYSPEQQVVLGVAEKEISRFLYVEHDEDVLLMFLEGVRKAYEALPDKPLGLNSDGEEGEYRLTLDDARMVINDVLTPKLYNILKSRRKQILSSLRCIGCTRSDVTKVYGFETLMSHVRNVHARRVGQDMHFWRLAVPAHSRIVRAKDNVAWYFIPWPKSMPALPNHHRASPGIVWNPDVERPYTPYQAKEVVLFRDLQACHQAHVAGHNFEGNFCEAVRVLLPTRLDWPSMARVALEYATHRRDLCPQSSGCSTDSAIEQLRKLQRAVADKFSSVRFEFVCGMCPSDREDADPDGLDALIIHWSNAHDLLMEETIEELIELPRDAQLQQTITELDAKLEAQQRRARVRARNVAAEANRCNDIRLDPRSLSLLNIPTIRSRFNQLFVKPLMRPQAPLSPALRPFTTPILEPGQSIGRGDKTGRGPAQAEFLT